MSVRHLWAAPPPPAQPTVTPLLLHVLLSPHTPHLNPGSQHGVGPPFAAPTRTNAHTRLTRLTRLPRLPCPFRLEDLDDGLRSMRTKWDQVVPLWQHPAPPAPPVSHTPSVLSPPVHESARPIKQSWGIRGVGKYPKPKLPVELTEAGYRRSRSRT